MRQKIAAVFAFEEAARPRLTFSDDRVRLNPKTSRLELRRAGWDSNKQLPVYDVPGSHEPPEDIPWVRTWATAPEALLSWAGFWCEPGRGLPAGTAVKFRLSDGADDYYWRPAGGPGSPAGWYEVSAAQWNTHDEVAAHIATFYPASRELAIVVGLETTDENASPWCSSVEALMDCELEPIESLVAGSLVPALRAGIRPPVDFAMVAPGGLTVRLDTDTPFNVASVLAVYDHAADPHHRASILHAYDAGSRTITLTAPAARGAQLWVTFSAEPEMAVNWGSQDYVEVEKVPAVVIDDIRVEAWHNWGEQSVKDLPTLTANVRRRPIRLAIRFQVVLLAERTRTLLAMMEQTTTFLSSTPVLRWRDTDQEVSLAGAGPGFRQRPNLGDKHEAIADMRIENAYMWPDADQTKHLVERINVTISPKPEGS